MLTNVKIKELIRDIMLISVGSLIFAFGLNYFYIANKLADGGLSGISIILYYIFGFNVGTTYLLLNIPLLFLGYKLIGKKFILKTFYGTLMTSLGMKIFANYSLVLSDRIMASIFGGVVTGIGLGIIFAGGGSSGGSDIFVKIMNKYFDIPIGKCFLLLDSIVLSVLCYFFGKEVFMYTLIGIYISTTTIDYIQDGFYKTKAVIVISNMSEQIKNEIIKEMDRGVTILKARGGYTNTDKEIIYCIVNRYEISQIKHIVKLFDKKAFISISDVSEVLGEGFKDIN